MVEYSTGKVIDRILKLEYSQYPNLNVHISVDGGRVFMRDTEFKADVTIQDGEITTVIPDCLYPKKYFSDCIKEKPIDIIPISIRHEKIIKKLLLAEMNEESLVLMNVKNHISRINTYWVWLNTPPSEGYAEPQYYLDKLSDYLDDAERYLNMLYLV